MKLKNKNGGYIVTMLLVTLAILVSNCDKHHVTKEYSTEYFPLTIGNKWEYKGVHEKVLVEVTDKVNMDCTTYYLFKERIFNKDGQLTSTENYYYRKTNDGQVFFKNGPDMKEVKAFDLVGGKGKYWTTKVDTANVMVKIAEDEHVFNVFGTRIKGCLVYSYDLPQSSDDDVVVILAKGLGIVAGIKATGRGDTLRYALINGVGRRFD